MNLCPRAAVGPGRPHPTRRFSSVETEKTLIDREHPVARPRNTCRFLKDTHPAMKFACTGCDRDTFDSSFQCLLEGQDAWLGVAHAPPGVVGYLLGFDHLTFFANGRVSWVEEVAVDKHWRRRGVGSTLIKRFERRARSRGSKLCALATRRAEPFYSAIGYQASATYFRRLL